MRFPSRSLLLAALGVVVIFAGMILAELQRDWSHAPTAEPVMLTLTGAQRLDSVAAAALDRRGAAVGLPLVKGTWVAAEMFVTGLRLTLPRGLEDRIQGGSIAIGQRRIDFTGEQVRAGWPRQAGDSLHVVYQVPFSPETHSSRIPGLGRVINWPGDAKVLTRALAAAAWKTGICLLILGLAFVLVPYARYAGVPRVQEPQALRHAALLCTIFAVLCGIAAFATVPFDDTTNPFGDSWEYQAMAVAAARGHGLNRLGGVEPFEAYRFRNAVNDSTDYRAQVAWGGGRFHTYRTPGYPAFLAGIYAVCGVSPRCAKHVQLLLLIIVAAFLPFLGFVSWGSKGLYAGIPAGMVFLDSWYGLASLLHTETLIIFVLFLFTLAMAHHQRRRSIAAAGMLGVISGAALLVKGDLVFIPPLVVVLLAWQAWKRHLPLAHLAVYALLCAVIVAPWSIYASRESGHFMVLSTQGGVVLLEGNNELSLGDGAWHPEVRMDPAAFYNREEIRNLPVSRQLARFTAAYASRIPGMLLAKLNEGFGHFPYLRLAGPLLLLQLLLLLRRPSARSGETRHGGVGSAALRGAGLALVLLAAAASIPLMILLVCAAAGIAGGRGALKGFLFPVSFVILFANFVLITIVAFGDRRFVSVIDAEFMLTGLTLLLIVLMQLLTHADPLSVSRVRAGSPEPPPHALEQPL